MKIQASHLAVALICLAAVVLAIYYFNGENPGYRSSVIDSMAFLRAYPAYSVSQGLTCTRSPILNRSIGLSYACTEVFDLPNATANVTGLPYSIISIYYEFSNASAAISYAQSTTGLLNSTPWPSDVHLSPGNSPGSANNVYYATMTYLNPTIYKKVYTKYIVNGTGVEAISALTLYNATNATAAEGMVSKLFASYIRTYG